MLIRIAGHNWTLKPADAEMLGAGLYGQTQYTVKKIVFTTVPPLDTQRQTVLHELLHAVKESYIGTRWPNEEEDTIQQLSTGLFQVLEDNPELCCWLWPVDCEYDFPTEEQNDST